MTVTVEQMIKRLEEDGCAVQRMEGDDRMIHVDGYFPPDAKGLPPWIWDEQGWSISTCGIARVFMTRVG